MDNMTGIKRVLFMGVVIGFTLIAILLLPTNREESSTEQITTQSVPLSNDDVLNPGNVPEISAERCVDKVSFVLMENPEAWVSQEAGEQWCEQCVADGGVIDIGPASQSLICNQVAVDSGTPCVDSSECEGTCLAEGMDAQSGACSEYTQLTPGCGWFEMIDGEVAELCVD